MFRIRHRKGEEGFRVIIVMLILLVFLLVALFFVTDMGDAIMNMLKGFFGMFG